MRVSPARLVVSHSSAELDALHRDVNRWFAVSLAVATLAGLGLAAWLSAGLSRPLAALAQATSTIALDGPDVELATGRDDEIGTLARRFGVDRMVDDYEAHYAAAPDLQPAFALGR